MPVSISNDIISVGFVVLAPNIHCASGVIETPSSAAREMASVNLKTDGLPVCLLGVSYQKGNPCLREMEQASIQRNAMQVPMLTACVSNVFLLFALLNYHATTVRSVYRKTPPPDARVKRTTVESLNIFL